MQQALSKLQSMRGRLFPWRDDLKQIGPYSNYQYVRGFSGERLSGFILDRFNNPVIAYVHSSNGMPNSEGVLLGCNSVDSYGINLWPGMQEVYVNKTRLGGYRINQGIFDNAGICIGNLGPKEHGPGGEHHFKHSFVFRSGTKGTISYMKASSHHSFQHTNFNGDPISIEQGTPTREEMHWLIVLHLLITAEIIGVHWPTQNNPAVSGRSEFPFWLRMLLSCLFLLFGMPIVNSFIFPLMFPGYTGSMDFTQWTFCFICFFICGRVFLYTAFGTFIIKLIFNRDQPAPATRAERIKMEKSSNLNLIIIPTGFIVGFIWGFIMGMFDKQLDAIPTAWTMGAYGFGFALMIFGMIKLSLISLFALSFEDSD